MKKLLSAGLLLVLLGALSSPGLSSDENIAKGCPVSVSPAPNYGNTGNDPKSLTDGIYFNPSKGHLWISQGSVGWENAPIANMTIDLRKIQPISGVSFSTASGEDSVLWPGSIAIWVSDDSKAWRYVGDLISLSEKDGIPQSETYANYRFVTHDLKTQGRYLRLSAIPGNAFIFCDEIEVYKGSDHLLTKASDNDLVTDTDSWTHDTFFKSRVIYRRTHDSDAVRSAVKASGLPEADKSRLYRRLDEVDANITSVSEQDSDHFEAILPIDDNDAASFSVYGSLLKAQGLPQLFAWKKHPYDWLALTEVPTKSPYPAKLSISMLRNEYRSDCVLLTNASESLMNVSMQVTGVPGTPKPKWLSIASIAWTDTAPGTPIASAMQPIECKDGTFQVRIPAGITTKIWVTVDSHQLASGTYQGGLKISSSGKTITIPLNVRVSPVSMGRPRLSFCDWDYCFKTGHYAVNEKTYDTALADMRAHYVDSPWAQSKDLPWPTADSFDSKGNLVKPLSFADFDHWILRWSEARHYFVYLDGPTNFCGTTMGSDEFQIRVGNWMKALADHMRSIGLKPEQLGIMVRDEPDVESRRVIIAWAKAMKAAESGILICQDCNIARPDQGELMADALKSADINIPMIGTYYAGGEAAGSFFKNMMDANHKVWFYQCEGPGHLLDPYRYHRLEAWHCFKHGATGMGLWAFGDTGAYKSSWNEYSLISNEYTPLFFRSTDITDSVHWEAVREGIEDYEYLSMLKDAGATAHSSELKARAERLLNDSVDDVLGKFYTPQERWNTNDESSKADLYRLRILHLLEVIKASETDK